MSTLEKTEGRSMLPLVLVIVILALASGLIEGVFEIRFTRHSKVSHPNAITQIEDCFNGGGSLSNIYRMKNGRWSQYCDDGSENGYWRIYKCEEGERLVITQFKQSIRKFHNYVANHGMREAPIPCY